MGNCYVLIVTGDSAYKENTLQEASKHELIVEYVDTMEEADSYRPLLTVISEKGVIITITPFIFVATCVN